MGKAWGVGKVMQVNEDVDGDDDDNDVETNMRGKRIAREQRCINICNCSPCVWRGGAGERGGRGAR